MPEIRPVLLAGGPGSRLWPLSRAGAPKSLHGLTGAATMLQQTALRFHGRPGFAPPLVVCGASLGLAVAEQLRQAGVAPSALLLEPDSRNTAAAAALAAIHAVETAPDDMLLVLPTDHVVENADALAEAVRSAVAAADAGMIVVFGAPPDRAETGYGYIRPGQPVAGAPGCRRVLHFVEKPAPAAARRYFRSGDYLWNVGIFLFRAQTWLDELDRFAPDIARACRSAMSGAEGEPGCRRPAAAPFLAAPAAAIDTAVMEKTRRAAVVAAGPGWSDIGSWRTLRDMSPQDGHGNAVVGDVVIDGVRNSLIRAESRVVAAIGMEGVAIVETADAVLVADMAEADRVGTIAGRLHAAGRREAPPHGPAPASGPGYRIWTITLMPGDRRPVGSRGRLHLLILNGTARLSPGGGDAPDVQTVTAAEHFEIPAGQTWEMDNPGPGPLEAVATAFGDHTAAGQPDDDDGRGTA